MNALTFAFFSQFRKSPESRRVIFFLPTICPNYPFLFAAWAVVLLVDETPQALLPSLSRTGQPRNGEAPHVHKSIFSLRGLL